MPILPLRRSPKVTVSTKPAITSILATLIKPLPRRLRIHAHGPAFFLNRSNTTLATVRGADSTWGSMPFTPDNDTLVLAGTSLTPLTPYSNIICAFLLLRSHGRCEVFFPRSPTKEGGSAHINEGKKYTHHSFLLFPSYFSVLFTAFFSRPSSLCTLTPSSRASASSVVPVLPPVSCQAGRRASPCARLAARGFVAGWMRFGGSGIWWWRRRRLLR